MLIVVVPWKVLLVFEILIWKTTSLHKQNLHKMATEWDEHSDWIVVFRATCIVQCWADSQTMVRCTNSYARNLLVLLANSKKQSQQILQSNWLSGQSYVEKVYVFIIVTHSNRYKAHRCPTHVKSVRAKSLLMIVAEHVVPILNPDPWSDQAMVKILHGNWPFVVFTALEILSDRSSISNWGS